MTAQEHVLDVILMDIRLPWMDGYLEKPIRVKEFPDQVRRYVEGRGQGDLRGQAEGLGGG